MNLLELIESLPKQEVIEYVYPVVEHPHNLIELIGVYQHQHEVFL